MQMPSEKRFLSCCDYHRTLSRVRVERKALPLRSCIAQFDPWSRGNVGRIYNAFQMTWRLSSLQKRVSGSNAFQIALFSAFQKGVSNPLIKTALRLSSTKITLKVIWKPKILRHNVMINAPKVSHNKHLASFLPSSSHCNVYLYNL